VQHDGSPTLVAPADHPCSSAFVTAAGHASRLLPTAVHDALVDFADQPHRSGALLLKGMPLGALPATPATPTTPASKDHTSELTLLTVARRLGQPVGYEPEHGGDIVQNIVPVQGTADRQVSTSSKVHLMFHTEAAFQFGDPLRQRRRRHAQRRRGLGPGAVAGDGHQVAQLRRRQVGHEVVHIVKYR
jgi:hypothetical protein